MFLCLVQHAEAVGKEEDPTRPLSEKGFEDVRKMALYISQLNIQLAEIYHSTKLRAAQTAEVLADYLKPPKGISEVEGLDPLDDPEIWAERLKGITDNIMLVGHLPHLAKLASLLLCGDMDKDIIAFKMAGIVCLKRDEGGGWFLQWMITPEIVF